MFESFCPFLSSRIISGHQIVLSADGLHDRTPETKIVLNVFSLQNMEFFSAHSVCLLYDLITKKARKLEFQSRISS